MIYIGIDPGLDGAIAFLTEESATVVSTPTLTRVKNKGTKREYNIPEMREILLTASLGNEDVVKAILEGIHSMPGQGVTSMFSMGFGFGIWQGLLSALLIPYELVPPQRWKKIMLDGTGKDKEASRLKALQLFPKLSQQLKFKKDEGRAEALLMAEYLKRTNGI